MRHDNTLKNHTFSPNFYNKVWHFSEKLAVRQLLTQVWVSFFPTGSVIHNDSGVYFQTSTPLPIRVPNTSDFATLKTRIHNTLQLTDKQFLDKIYYRQSFTDTDNQIRFQ